MKKQQLSKNLMFKRLVQFFNQYDGVLILFIELYSFITSFKADNDDLDKFIDKQTPKSKGVTNAKDTAFATMFKLTVRFGRKARVWAKKSGNLDLAALFDIRLTDLEDLAEEEALSKCRLISKNIHENIASLTAVKVLGVDDTALSNAVKAAADALGAPGSVISMQQAGTEAIAETMQRMDETLMDIDDLLIGEYEETEPDMVKEYENNRKIDDLGVRHNHIQLHITDDDDDSNVAGATAVVEGTEKSAISDVDGIADIIKVKSGDCIVKVTKIGYVAKVVNVKALRGKTVRVEVKLKKI